MTYRYLLSVFEKCDEIGMYHKFVESYRLVSRKEVENEIKEWHKKGEYSFNIMPL